MELAAAGRAVRADLVVEADDLIAVVGAEEHEVAGVRLPDESFDGAGERGLRAVWLEGIAPPHVVDRAIPDHAVALRALDANGVALDGADEPNSRMDEQLRVELRPTPIAGDRFVVEPLRRVGEVHERE